MWKEEEESRGRNEELGGERVTNARIENREEVRSRTRRSCEEEDEDDASATAAMACNSWWSRLVWSPIDGSAEIGRAHV